MADDKDTPDSGSNAAQPQPGAVIAPGTNQSPDQEQPKQAEPEEAIPTPLPEPPAEPEPETDPEPATKPEPETEAESPGDNGQKITWTASEFIAHDKSTSWYILLMLGTLLLAAAVFFVTRDFVSVSVAIIAGLLLGIYGAHQPRQLEYVVDRRGIGIGRKYYSYDEFKSFAVAPEGAFSSLVLMPLKRFAIPTTIYYAPEDEERILNILADHLPLEEHHRDTVDSLMRHIRF